MWNTSDAITISCTALHSSMQTSGPKSSTQIPTCSRRSSICPTGSGNSLSTMPCRKMRMSCGAALPAPSTLK